MPSSIFTVIDTLKQERYRAALLHASPEFGPSMSGFCQTFCTQTKGKYLDLLDLFIQTPELNSTIDSFNPTKLRSLVIEHARAQSLLVVDRADFLLDTWRKSERQIFFRFVNNQWDGFKESEQAVLIFSLQTSSEIEELNLMDSRRQSRIFRLGDFNDIG